MRVVRLRSRRTAGESPDCWGVAGLLGSRRTAGESPDCWGVAGLLGSRRTVGESPDCWAVAVLLGSRRTAGESPDCWGVAVLLMSKLTKSEYPTSEELAFSTFNYSGNHPDILLNILRSRIRPFWFSQKNCRGVLYEFTQRLSFLMSTFHLYPSCSSRGNNLK